MRILRILVGIVVALLLCGVFGYAAWYSYNRESKLAQVQECASSTHRPKPPTMMRAPDGALAPVYSLETCTAVVVPPSLFDLVRGRIVFSDVPERMKVNPYTFKDILLGTYTLGPGDIPACDQSATTTDCAALMARKPSAPFIKVSP